MNLKPAGLLVAAAVLLASCTSVPWLNDCTDFTSYWTTTNWETSIPVIVVGRIVSNVAVRHQHPSCQDAYHTVQLYRVTIEVENVLRGESIADKIGIYYFAEVGSLGGPARLGMRENGGRWHTGDRELFLLRRDSGVLRTMCDGLAVCVCPVFTGAHPGFRVDPTKPIAYSVVRLLLARGEKCSDKQMIEAIESHRAWHFSTKYTIARLQEIAQTETPDVRSAACKELADITEAIHTTVAGLEQTCPKYRPK